MQAAQHKLPLLRPSMLSGSHVDAFRWSLQKGHGGADWVRSSACGVPWDYQRGDHRADAVAGADSYDSGVNVSSRRKQDGERSAPRAAQLPEARWWSPIGTHGLGRAAAQAPEGGLTLWHGGWLAWTEGFPSSALNQEPKKNPKAKQLHEQRQRIFWTIRGGYRSLPIKTRVLRQIKPESSPESSAKSLSQRFFGVPFLSLTEATGDSQEMEKTRLGGRVRWQGQRWVF